MAIVDDIVGALTKFGTDLKEDTQKSLRDKGVTFGGQDSKLSARMKFEIKKSGDTITFSFIMPEYAGAVDKGRKAAPVSKAGQKSIQQWAQRKGIVGDFQAKTLQARLQQQSQNKTARRKKALTKLPFDKASKALAYLISRKLKNKGFEGNHFYSEVINDGRLDTLKVTLAQIMKQDVLIEIRNGLN